MTRLNLILLLVLIGCSLSVVTSQNKARKIFNDLQTEQDKERKLDQEWRELQIENQTLVQGKRIEQRAGEIGMTQPDPKRTVIVVLDDAVAKPAKLPAAEARK